MCLTECKAPNKYLTNLQSPTRKTRTASLEKLLMNFVDGEFVLLLEVTDWQGSLYVLGKPSYCEFHSNLKILNVLGKPSYCKFHSDLKILNVLGKPSYFEFHWNLKILHVLGKPSYREFHWNLKIKCEPNLCQSQFYLWTVCYTRAALSSCCWMCLVRQEKPVQCVTSVNKVSIRANIDVSYFMSLEIWVIWNSNAQIWIQFPVW